MCMFDSTDIQEHLSICMSINIGVYADQVGVKNHQD